MARTRWLWLPSTALAIGLCLAAMPAVADPAEIAVPDQAVSKFPANPFEGTPIRSITVRLPQGSTSANQSNQPLDVLLALHGMGGNGPDFARDLTEQADRYGWVILAPTIDYGDWTNPGVVAHEDPLLIQALAAYTDRLPAAIGAPVHKKLLILGHSRGAQLAHRFAEFRPERVLAVAAMSAGTYTMPEQAQFPFGVQDMQQYDGHPFDEGQFEDVAMLVGVGGQDTNPAEVPRQWDAVEGTNRLLRAQAFEAAADELGAHVELRVFAGARHELTGEMRAAACEFLETAATSDD